MIAHELAHFLTLDLERTTVEAGSYSYRVDVVVRDLNLVVEYDGWLWHKNRYSQDTQKNERLEAAGWTVLRIREQKTPAESLSKIRSHDIPAPYQSPKSAAVQVLRWVEKRFGTVIAGLDEYEVSPDLVSGSAAEEYVAGIPKGKSRSRKWINEKPVQNIDTGEVFSSGYAAARALGLKNLDKIGNAIRGGYRCAGFRWKFASTPSPTPEETHCSLVEPAAAVAEATAKTAHLAVQP